MPRSISLIAALALLGGCAIGPEYRAPAVDLPDAWPDDAVLAPPSDTAMVEWWRAFEDPVLDRLVARALADNLDLRLQAARVEEARARLGLASADRLPTVGIQAEATRRRQPAAAFGIEGFDIPPQSLFVIAGVLGYEIDLWGRLARQREAAAADFAGNVFARDAVRIALVADVVVGYFGLRAAQRQLEITGTTRKAREETLRIERLRHEAGMIDELSLRQAEVELAATRAELPARVEALRRRETALGILLGLSPAELIATLEIGEGELDALTLPGEIPAALPSELLARRPDLRAAEAELMAATARVGVAQAERLPRLNLAALVGTAAASTGMLFDGDSEQWNAGASLNAPVAHFGRGRARVATADALRDQAELRYRATVAMAFAEVRDALAFYQGSGDRLAAIGEQVDALRRVEALAGIRYREGFIGIIELLDAQRGLLGAELALTEALSDRFTATATLFKALGGGWEAHAW
jgi:outer membrane protein, multidrug efflux system